MPGRLDPGHPWPRRGRELKPAGQLWRRRCSATASDPLWAPITRSYSRDSPGSTSRDGNRGAMIEGSGGSGGSKERRASVPERPVPGHPWARRMREPTGQAEVDRSACGERGWSRSHVSAAGVGDCSARQSTASDRRSRNHGPRFPPATSDRHGPARAVRRQNFGASQGQPAGPSIPTCEIHAKGRPAIEAWPIEGTVDDDLEFEAGGRCETPTGVSRARHRRRA